MSELRWKFFIFSLLKRALYEFHLSLLKSIQLLGTRASLPSQRTEKKRVECFHCRSNNEAKSFLKYFYPPTQQALLSYLPLGWLFHLLRNGIKEGNTITTAFLLFTHFSLNLSALNETDDCAEINERTMEDTSWRDHRTWKPPWNKIFNGQTLIGKLEPDICWLGPALLPPFRSILSTRFKHLEKESEQKAIAIKTFHCWMLASCLGEISENEGSAWLALVLYESFEFCSQVAWNFVSKVDTSRGGQINSRPKFQTPAKAQN